MPVQPHPLPFRVLACLALASVWVVPARAQAGGEGSARLRVQENFRAEPNGTVLAVLRSGGELTVVERGEHWVRATVEGWIWAPSVQRDEGGLGLRVSAPQGENLRAEPSGEILGRLEEGMRLEEAERVQGWIRVRRTGWIWARSLEPGDEGTPPDPEAGTSSPEWLQAGPAGASILNVPDGDTLARVREGSQLRVQARQGNWARVRLEGWIWRPDSGDGVSDAAILTAVTPEELAADPEAYRGRVVSLELRFISLERAEKARTDFFEGEPFLLTRALGGGRSFVYVAVPPDRVAEVQGITPLERVTVVGRVRTGATSLTGNPILELLELEHPPRRR